MSISKKRAKAIKSIKDKDIDYSDIPELSESFFKSASIEIPRTKTAISFRIDSDVLEWFKSQGEKYQTKMTAVLKAFKTAYKQHSLTMFPT